jgi:hypothetical protein
VAWPCRARWRPRVGGGVAEGLQGLVEHLDGGERDPVGLGIEVVEGALVRFRLDRDPGAGELLGCGLEPFADRAVGGTGGLGEGVLGDATVESAQEDV